MYYKTICFALSWLITKKIIFVTFALFTLYLSLICKLIIIYLCFNKAISETLRECRLHQNSS